MKNKIKKIEKTEGGREEGRKRGRKGKEEIKRWETEMNTLKVA